MGFVYKLYGTVINTYAVCNGCVSECCQTELGSFYHLCIKLFHWKKQSAWQNFILKPLHSVFLSIRNSLTVRPIWVPRNQILLTFVCPRGVNFFFPKLLRLGNGSMLSLLTILNPFSQSNWIKFWGCHGDRSRSQSSGVEEGGEIHWSVGKWNDLLSQVWKYFIFIFALGSSLSFEWTYCTLGWFTKNKSGIFLRDTPSFCSFW